MYAGAPLALGVFRSRLPDAERPYRLPAARVLAPLAFAVANLLILWSGWTTDWKLGVAILIGYVILARTTSSSSTRPRPQFEVRSARLAAGLPVGMGADRLPERLRPDREPVVPALVGHARGRRLQPRDLLLGAARRAARRARSRRWSRAVRRSTTNRRSRLAQDAHEQPGHEHQPHPAEEPEHRGGWSVRPSPSRSVGASWTMTCAIAPAPNPKRKAARLALKAAAPIQAPSTAGAPRRAPARRGAPGRAPASRAARRSRALPSCCGSRSRRRGTRQARARRRSTPRRWRRPRRGCGGRCPTATISASVAPEAPAAAGLRAAVLEPR